MDNPLAGDPYSQRAHWVGGLRFDSHLGEFIMVVAMKKIVTLRIKVPANVTVITQLIPTLAQVGTEPIKGMEHLANMPATMEMDLTSQKTSQWLSGARRLAAADCNCCCVRG
jgi:hypothetical protein